VSDAGVSDAGVSDAGVSDAEAAEKRGVPGCEATDDREEVEGTLVEACSTDAFAPFFRHRVRQVARQMTGSDALRHPGPSQVT
jgi:hypothetical protein